MYFDPIHFYYSCLTPSYLSLIYSIDAIERYFAFVLWNSRPWRSDAKCISLLSVEVLQHRDKSSLWRKELISLNVPVHHEKKWGQELKKRLWNRFTGFLSRWKDWNLLVAQPQRLAISSVPIIHWRPGRFLELLLLSMLESQISWFNINQQRADELNRDSESKQKSKSPSRSFYLEKEKYDSDLGWIFFWIIQSKNPQRSVQQLGFWLVPVSIKLITKADHYRMILQTEVLAVTRLTMWRCPE